MKVLKELLRQPIAFHRVFVDLAGSVNAALFLSQACYWSDVTGWDWFYKTQQEWQKETGLTRHEQDASRKKLLKIKVLKEARRGVPARMYYQVQLDILADLIATFRQSSIPEKRQTGLPNSGNLYKEAEITQETTQKPCPPLSDAPKKEKKTDPRYQEFVDALAEGYKKGSRGKPWEFGFGPRDGKQLKMLLAERKLWTVETFKKCLHNYFASDGVVPGGQPFRYLPSLPNYWRGPLNEFGKLKPEARSADPEPESQFAQVHRRSIANDKEKGIPPRTFCHGNPCPACLEVLATLKSQKASA